MKKKITFQIFTEEDFLQVRINQAKQYCFQGVKNLILLEMMVKTRIMSKLVELSEIKNITSSDGRTK